MAIALSVALASAAVLAGPVASAPADAPAVPQSEDDGVQIEEITRAADMALQQGPSVADLAITQEDARGALIAFRTSCPSLINPNREDRSGLTQSQDWADACAVVKEWDEDDAAAFFQTHFETLQVGDGAAFATGYFEPEIAGSRTRRPGYEVPVYARPDDLVDVDLSQFADEWTGKRVRGRVEDGKLVRYADRTAIEDGALAGQGLEIAWAADPIEFFFLQIQGSGRLVSPEGEVIRIGYNGQNGHDYLGIGRVLRDEGKLEPGQANMQGIQQWLRDNPEEGRALMRRNASYIFFRELTGPGPLGSMGWPVSGEDSAAVDPAFVPMGAPVFLSMDRDEPNGLWVAQDTGGAIKGANRFDTFWGAGSRARTIAGGMSARGQALILVPKGTYARYARAAALR
ncbi:murein transglycosylase A [Alterisphingorhabdus coralli]|uniref:peptidoglycan lytic exotransglycosylase n=1 Tax=Alterisphingorhabdus coralli TaxID=3071408 RepID=A0AA97F6W6_9SPHN|nr:murein transglycosylase A [Parasphingorhabdus sp. SCSIO 66989]WOE75046.1 murein transglycosylase A [Parasphingorhabdus sp. SCSIO 66989]